MGKRAIVRIIFCCIALSAASGCALRNDTIREIAGISVFELEGLRKNAEVKIFGEDYFTCFTKTLDILKKLDMYIYRQDIKKYLIAVYMSKEDSTAVGLFFKEVNKDETKIEITSPSSYAKEFVAKRIFTILEKTFRMDKDLDKFISEARNKPKME